jgi:hypothetical protein
LIFAAGAPSNDGERKLKAMKRAHALIAGAALLASCSGGAGGDNESQAATTVQEPMNEALYQDQQNTVVPITTPSPHAANALPASFTGKWALVEGDCDPSRGDNKGLMTVEPAKVSFYESRGTIASLQQVGPTQIDLRLSMNGEGQVWSSDETLTLVDEGRTLVRDTKSPTSSERYQRCPA